jgi:hypothetical protein
MDRYLEIVENSADTLVAKVRPNLTFPNRDKKYGRVKFYKSDVYRLCPSLERNVDVKVGDSLLFDKGALVRLLEERAGERKKEGSDMILDFLSEEDIQLIDDITEDQVVD